MKTKERLIILSILCLSEVASYSELYNVTKGIKDIHSRRKRFILFDGGGVCKLVAAFSLPVELSDKKPWRSLSCEYNLQAQFAVPTAPIYWWDKWNGRTLLETKRQFNEDGYFPSDESRQFAYALIEMYANRAGKSGKKCLARAICENASIDEHQGIFDKIIQIILTPGDDSDVEYKNAYQAGRYGAICSSVYPECPLGNGILDGLAVTRGGNYFQGR